MKLIALGTMLFSLFANAQDSDCQTMKLKKLQMEIIELNIANVNTTKTAEGGPYKRKKLVCEKTMCAEISYDETITKHIPNHPDADKLGNVKFPNINVEKELENMIETRSAFEVASRNCSKS